MHLYTSPGVVLNKLRYLESDLIVTVFSKTEGKVKAMVKGGANSKKRFPGAFEVGNAGEFGFVEKNSYQLTYISHAKISNYFPKIRNDYKKIMMLSYILGITDSMLTEHHKHPGLFDALIDTLQSLDEDKTMVKVRLLYELNLLKEIGLLPAIEKCELCGASFKNEVNFLKQIGKFVCNNCIPPDAEFFRIPDYLLEWIKAINSDKPINIYDVNYDIPHSIFNITTTLMANYIDKPLKIWQIINTIH